MTTMTLRIPDELDAEVRAAAEDADLSINGFIIEAIRERLEDRRHERVMAVASRIIARDKDLLERLGSA
ncbi:MAG: toxin-antitoxin system HicB family antitoxin [Catenulispora sp.]|nr:toxin-antitoxin system HicB family antitoxin [Catenulispora sp.]